jgi:hypothetical protein
MGLKKYDVEVNGYRTTLLLSDEDAKAQGLLKSEPKAQAKQAPAPANKARKAPNKKA